MKKQLALVLLTSMATPTVSILAMDKSKMQSQTPKSEIANNNCNTCNKDLNITNSCTKCKNLCRDCLKHNQKLEEADSNRSDLIVKSICQGGIVLLVAAIFGASYDMYKRYNPTKK